jgi:dTDP-L-rhamnose 4-epimerase
VGETVLITGGAGFIGRHVASALLDRGHRVRVMDVLIDQVHQGRGRPDALDPEAELIVADIRDEAALERALRGIDSVIHLAAEVGVGQSMYAVDRYVSVNEYGSAVLFQKLIETPVRRVVTASSMSIYGEGLYQDIDGRLFDDVARAPHSPNAAWDPLDHAGRPLLPLPTPETKRPNLASVYALGKYAQERMTITLAAAYGMEGVALRLFNVYGPGQALSNPYTGVLAIFASRLANGQSPMIFEDGAQRRDFVHVRDVAHAFVAALEHPRASGQVYNFGSGHERTVREVAELLARAMRRQDVTPEILGKGRTGDVRHCFGDLTKIHDELGVAPREDFSLGLEELAEWVACQSASDHVPEARRELEIRGLVA